MAPSSISYQDGNFPEPVEASAEYIENLKQAYAAAVERCKTIGFDFIEIHGAHGYLFHGTLLPYQTSAPFQSVLMANG
jgi:2,4-dienoyl-CoA reductase-like NADH-dependent reductase (Old Yellow Enzyme family)